MLFSARIFGIWMGCASCAAAGLWAQEAGGRGQIRGSVADWRGKALAEAQVVASRMPVQGQPTMPFIVHTKTGADGSFVVAGLPEGTYQVCAHMPGSDLINPCAWSVSPPTATIAASQSAVMAPIVLARGRPLNVRIEDPGGLLETNEGKTQGAHLLVGVWWGPGMFVPLQAKGKDIKGRSYETVVPVDVPLQLSAFSTFYRMGDASGKPLAKIPGTNAPENVPLVLREADTYKAHTFTVLGKQ